MMLPGYVTHIFYLQVVISKGYFLLSDQFSVQVVLRVWCRVRKSIWVPQIQSSLQLIVISPCPHAQCFTFSAHRWGAGEFLLILWCSYTFNYCIARYYCQVKMQKLFTGCRILRILTHGHTFARLLLQATTLFFYTLSSFYSFSFLYCEELLLTEQL